MKKFCLILSLLLTLIISGCMNNKDMDDKVSPVINNKYDIEKETYTNNNIIINYPQVIDTGNSDKQKKINELIKMSALKLLDDYKDDINNLNLNMDFKIMYKGSDILSIQYLGLLSLKNAAYPINEINTTNLDLANEKLLTLSDVVTVNEHFVDIFKDGKYRAYSSDLNLESVGALNDVLNGYGSNDILADLKQETANFYFTENSVVVSANVIHAMGDHFEMEIEYKNLDNLLFISPVQ